MPLFIRIVFWLFLGLTISFAQASEQQGLLWLKQAVTAVNTVNGANQSIASPFQAQTETAYSLALLDQLPNELSALKDDDQSTEALSRTLLIAQKTGADTSVLIQQLVARQNRDGGFGHLNEWQSNPLDTALALFVIPSTETVVINSAIAYLQANQRADGGYVSTSKNPADLYSSIYVLNAFNLRVQQYPALVSNANLLVSFLESKQSSISTWQIEDLFIQALINQVLHHYRTTTEVEAQFLQTALSQQQANGSWDNDPYVTAVILRSLNAQMSVINNPVVSGIQLSIVDTETDAPVSMVHLESVLTHSVTSVTADSDVQGHIGLSNLKPGSYRFLLSREGYLASQFDINLQQGESLNVGTIKLGRTATLSDAQVLGTITDLATGLAVDNAVVLVNGVQTLASGEKGTFKVHLPSTGQFVLEISKPGYTTIQASGFATVGQMLALSFELRTQATNQATLSGTVTDDSGHPLENVTIKNGTISLGVTDSQGIFSFSQIPAGLQQLVFVKKPYQDLPLSVTLQSGVQSDVGTVMMSSAVGGMATLTVRAMQNNGYGYESRRILSQPLIKAEQLNTSGGVIQTQTYQSTDPLAQVATLQLPSGSWRVTVSHAGYLPATTTLVLSEDGTSTFDGYLNLKDYEVTGVVIDSQTNKPISNIAVNFNDVPSGWWGGANLFWLNTTTDQNGRFRLSGLGLPQVNVEINTPNYIQTVRNVDRLYFDGDVADLGSIRIRPTSAIRVFPDLVISRLDASALLTDQQMLQVTGILQVTISNVGNDTFVSGKPVILTAFSDLNHNRLLDVNEPILGKGSLITTLGIKQDTQVPLTIEGKLEFRDAPIAVWVDSDSQIAEKQEDNNVLLTSDGTQIKPPIGTLDPEVVWHWSPAVGSRYAEYDQVMANPISGPLQDTNHDGKIDDQDETFIIFSSFYSYKYNSTIDSGQGVLRVIHGRNGAELWSSGPQESIVSPAPTGTPAIGDIDGDGRPDIVITTAAGISVYNNDGSLKWHKELGVSPPYFEYFPISLIDLDGDGKAEIIVGLNVINSDGVILWQIQNNGFWLKNTIVADTNNDGKYKVISGGAIFDALTGELLSVGNDADGFSAVADFDEDGYPEIAVVKNSRLYLYDHIGKIIWGPVVLPGGGYGGAPTIADMNGDGLLDIGVAGASAYSVFNGDGALMWSMPTSDGSSNVTGSTVFDFEADGKAEVLYADELNFRIYSGQDGRVLFESNQTSGTLIEQPIVVDADHDGHADIITACNDYYQVVYHASGTRCHGVKMFSGKNRDWARTRSIWNQNSYHITNVNDDGSLPVHEQNSWEASNSYRLNTIPGVNVLSVADLTASYIRIADQGLSGPSMFTVRIGNGGGNTAAIGLPVSFYRGNPASGGVLLGTVQTSIALKSGYFEDINFAYSGVLDSFGELYVVANDAGTGQISNLPDYTRNNNIAHLSVNAGNEVFSLNTSLNKPNYQSADSLMLSANVANGGSFTNSALVQFAVIDSVGQVIAELPSQSVTLAAQGQSSLLAAWPTKDTRAGSYSLKTTLVRQGVTLATRSNPFQIDSDAATSGVLTTALTTDKAEYSADDFLTLSLKVRNTSTNQPSAMATLVLDILNPDTSVRWTQTVNLDALVPQSVREQNYVIPLQNAPAGAYQARFTTHVAGQIDTTELVTFRVLPSSTTGSGLSGMLTGIGSGTLGQSQSYQWGLYNQGNSNLSVLPVRIVIIDTSTEALVSTVVADSITVNQGQTESRIGQWISNGSVNKPLVAVLQVQLAGQWKTMAQQAFSLQTPPLVLTLMTDKPIYDLNDTVTVMGDVFNQSPVALSGLSAVTTITQPDGSVAKTDSIAMSVAAHAHATESMMYPLGRAAAGDWTILTIIKNADGIEWARNTSSFTVQSTAVTGSGLSASVTVPATVVKGGNADFAWTLVNNGNAALNNLPLRLVVTDSASVVLSTLTATVASLAVDSTESGVLTWPVMAPYGTVVRGTIQIQVNGQWKPLASATITVTKPAITMTISSDKTSYDINEPVTISNHFVNQSAVNVSGVNVVTTITSPTGQVVKTDTSTVSINAQGQLDKTVTYALSRAAAGQWTANTVVKDAQGVELNRQQSNFTVLSSAVTGTGISATLVATPVEVKVGDSIALALSVKNLGNADLTNQVVTLTIIRNQEATPVQTLTTILSTLAQNSTIDKALSWIVAGKAGDTFTVTASTLFNNQKKVLASSAFIAKVAAIAVELKQEIGSQSRVLVYYSCGHDWYKDIRGWSFGDCHYSCFSSRAATLKGYLDSMGINYTLVTKESDFIKTFRSGRYNSTWLLGAIEKLPKDFNEELHEAINRGDALLLDGGVETWYNHDIYDIAGVQYRGRLNFSNSQLTPTLPVFTNTTAIGKPHSAGWPLYLKVTTGIITATYGANQCQSVQKDWDREKEHDEDRDFYGRHDSTYPAIVSNVYGKGKAISMAFDLIGSLEQPTEKASWLALLQQSLTWSVPTITTRTNYVAHEFITLRSTLTNAATTAQSTKLQVKLPVGAVWMGAGTVAADRSVTQTITVPAKGTQQVWLPLLLPTLAGTHSVSINLLSADGLQVISQQEQRFTIQGSDQRLAQVRIAFEQLSLNKADDKHRDDAVKDIIDAQNALSRGRYEDALDELGDAAEEIREIAARDVSVERLALDEAMKAVSIQWFDTKR